MNITKEQFEELCAAYAIGALEADREAALFGALEDGGEEFQKIFSESVGVSYMVNQAVTRHTPSPLVKRDLFKKIFKGTKQSFSFSQLFDKIAITLGFGNPRFGLVVSLLLVVVAIEVTVYAYVMDEEINTRDEQIAYFQAKLQQQQQLLLVQNEVELQREILTVLQSPKLEIVIMSGQQINPAGYGKIMWDPERKAAIIQISKLPAAPSDKDYQLWYLDKAKTPVSAGIFNVEKENESYFKVTQISVPDKNEISAFAVTIEPKGGVPQPTGAMYLLGSPSL